MKKRLKRSLAVLLTAALTLGSLQITESPVQAAELETKTEMLDTEQISTEQVSTEEISTEQLETEEIETEEISTETEADTTDEYQGGVSLKEVSEAPAILTRNNYTLYGFTDTNYSKYLGYYVITSAEDLCAFSDLVVNAGWTKKNAVLTADLDMTDAEYTPLGVQYEYTGIIDGQGHRICNLVINSTSDMQGLIANAGNGVVIRNLIMDKSCSITGASYVASFIGRVVFSANNATIENCGTEASVTGTGEYVAGFVGRTMYARGGALNLTNCYNTGTIVGGSYAASFVGTGGKGTVLTNCYNTGSITGMYLQSSFVPYYSGGTPTLNSCYTLDTLTAQSGVTSFTASQFASGELCYLLNGSTHEGVSWYQKLGAGGNAIPLLESSEDSIVYAEYIHNADMIKDYHNEEVGHIEGNSIKAHTDYVNTNNVCSVCGMKSSAIIEIANAEVAVDCGYEQPVTFAPKITVEAGKNIISAVWYEVSGTDLTEVSDVTGKANQSLIIETGKTGGVYNYALIVSCGEDEMTSRKDVTFTVNRVVLTAEDFEVTLPSNTNYSGNVKTATTKLKTELTDIGDITVKYKKDSEEGLVDEAIEPGLYQVYIVVTETPIYQAVEIDSGKNFTIVIPDIASAPTKVTEDNYKLYDFTDENYSTYVDYYAITTAEELFGFAELVNDGTDTAAKGVLTDNITIPDGFYWTPIGTKAIPYTGILDGQNHTISGLVIDTLADYQGLIGYAKDSCTLRGITLDETCSIQGDSFISAMIGYVNSESCTVENCGNRASVSGVNYVGAIVGAYNYVYNSTSDTYNVIQTCYNTGAIKGNLNNYVAAICGHGGSNSRCYNTYNAGIVTGGSPNNKFFVSGTLVNCYQLDTVGTQSGVNSFQQDALESGAFCYMLNDNQSAGTTWYQKIEGDGTDAFPILQNDNSKLVYAEYLHGEDTVYAYHNTAVGHINTNESDEHNKYIESDLKCSACGAEASIGISIEDNIVCYYDYTEPITLTPKVGLKAGARVTSAIWYEVIDGVRKQLKDVTGTSNYSYQIPVGESAGVHRYVVEMIDSENGYIANKNVTVTICKYALTVEDIQVTLPKYTSYSGNRKLAVATARDSVQGTGTLTAKYKKDNEGELLDEAVETGTYYVYVCMEENDHYATTEIDTGKYFTIAYEEETKTPVIISSSNYKDYDFTEEDYYAYRYYYAITSAEELFGFAKIVNDGDRYARALLINDITIPEGWYWRAIGNNTTYETRYRGTIDGRGHTISNLVIDTRADYQGLIGCAGNGAVIRNLTLDETCSISGGDYVAGFCGMANSNNITIENCTNKARVTGNSKVAGFVGGTARISDFTITMQNCCNIGDIYGTTDSAAFIGYVGETSHDTKFVNCYNSGAVTGADAGYHFTKYAESYTFTNCYQLTSDNNQSGITVVDADMMAGGELCFLLNEKKTAGTIWYQKLGDGGDAYPTTTVDKEKLVYPEYTHDTDTAVGYHNTAVGHAYSVSEDVHNRYIDEKGICTVCKKEFVLAVTAQDVTACYGESTVLAAEIITQGDMKVSSAVWYEVTETDEGEILNKLEDITDFDNVTYKVPEKKSAGTYHYAVVAVGDQDNNTFRRDITLTITRAALTADDFIVTLPEKLVCDGYTKDAKVVVKETVVGLGEITVKYKLNNAGGFYDNASSIGTYQIYAIVTQGENYEAGEIDTGISFTITDASDVPKTTPKQITALNYEDYDLTEEESKAYIGYYGITNAEEMYGFAEIVNSGADTDADAVLTEDISFPDGQYWTPIGNTRDYIYTGTLDGRGHTITNLVIETNWTNQALIGWAGNGVVVCNLILDDTCSIQGNIWVAAFIAYILGSDSNYTIRNCGNHASVTGSSDVGSMLGSAVGVTHSTVRIENCYNTGTISSTSYSGYVSAMLGNSTSTDVECINCYNTGMIQSEWDLGVSFSMNAHVTNCYQLETVGVQDGVTSFAQEDVTSGALCYWLNESQSAGTNWYQGISGNNQDLLPTQQADESKLVYAEYTHGTDNIIGYHNEAIGHIEPYSKKNNHDEYMGDDFLCSACGEAIDWKVATISTIETDYRYETPIQLSAVIQAKTGAAATTAAWYDVTNEEEPVCLQEPADNTLVEYAIPTGKSAGVYHYALLIKNGEDEVVVRRDVTVTIHKYVLTADELSVTLPEDNKYNGKEKKAVIESKETIKEIGIIIVRYKKDNADTLVSSAVNGGTYRVYAVISGSTNYQAVTIDTGESFTITMPDTAAPTKVTEQNYKRLGFTDDNYQTYLDYYAITSAAELYGYAELINEGIDTSAKGVLTDDIEIAAGDYWRAMGAANMPYLGTLDGQGHTISGLIIDNETNNGQGLIGYAGTGAIVRCLTLDESCSIHGRKYVGGFIGQCNGYGIIVENCGNYADVTGEMNAAGVIGCIINPDTNHTVIIKCFNAGTIDGEEESAAIVAWSGKMTFVTNCYNSGTVSGIESGKSFARSSSNIWSQVRIQSSYQIDTVQEQAYVNQVTAEEISNGTLCYLLNNNQSAGTNWYQDLSEGAASRPVPTANENTLVYAEYEHGTDTILGYHNTAVGHTKSNTTDRHDNYAGTDLTCSVCSVQMPLGASVEDVTSIYSTTEAITLVPQIAVKDGTSITSAVWYELTDGVRGEGTDVTTETEKSYQIPAGKSVGTHTYELELQSSEDEFTIIKTVTVTIAKRTPTANDIEVTLPSDTIYNQSAKTAQITAKSYMDGIGAITVKYKKDNQGILLDAPSAVGTYQVYAVIADSENYESAFVDTGKCFTIAYSAAPSSILYNGAQKAASYTTGTVTISAANYTVSDKLESGYAASYKLTSTKSATVTKTLYFKDSAGHISAGTAVSVVFKEPAAAEKPAVTVQLPKKGATVKVGKAYYKVTVSSKTKGTVTYVKPTSKKLTSITVPDTVKIKGVTFKVTAIAANACKSNSKLTSLTIGSNVKTIGKNAFQNCKKLKKIKIKTTKLTTKNVGTNAFKNIYAKAKFSVPKAKVKSYKTLLQKRGAGKKCTVKKA